MYNGKETKEIEQVQLKYLKLMFSGVYGETGQFLIFILKKNNDFKILVSHTELFDP